MNQNAGNDVYRTYKPRSLVIEKIREKKCEIFEEIEEVINGLTGKIPFDRFLIKKLEVLKDNLIIKDVTPLILEKIEIILYFDKYGIPPDRTLSTSSYKDLKVKSWNTLRASVLGKFPFELCDNRKDIVSRARDLLNGLLTKKGKMPVPSDTETIALSNAIERGTYQKMGILTWNDLMFMTFGRNYFKYKLELQNRSPLKEQESDPSQNLNETQKIEVLSLIQWYQTTLSLDDALQREISRTYDILNQMLPKYSGLRHPKVLAEIIIFHVLKESKNFTDWDLFILISPLGNKSMGHRKWLLRYKQYLPSSIAYSSSLESPDLYLRKLYESTKITGDIKAECEKNKHILVKNFKCIRPKMIAGMACYLALKKFPERSFNFSEVLARMGIENLPSIINAIRRLKERREYSDDLFD